MASLSSMIKSLSPISSKAKVDKIVEILRERNTLIDYRIDKIVYDNLEDTELIDYYREKKKGLNHSESISSWLITTLIAYLKPINSIMKLNKLIEEIKKYGYALTLKDINKIRISITNDIVLKQWEIESKTINSKQTVKAQDEGSKIIKKQNVTTKQKTDKLLPYLAVRTNSDVDSIVAYFKVHKERLTPAADKWIQFSIVKANLYAYYKDEMSKAFYYYKRVTRKAGNVNISKLAKERLAELYSLQKMIEEFRNNGNIDMNPSKQSMFSKTDSTFDALKKKEWILDWNCVFFKRGSVVIFSRSDLGFKFKPTTVYVKNAIESFNYLKKYLNERLPSVRCSIVGQNLTVIDKINFDCAIQQFSAAARQSAIKTSAKGTSISVGLTPMSFSQALSKAKQMTPEEFKKYKSEYIDFLVTQQSKKYKVIPCVERLAHSTGDTTEYAFMFAIECRLGKILIVHENVNPDRSTLLFLVKTENFDKSIREIYDFLQSAEINKRSSLRDRNIDIRNAGIESYRSINHDEIYSWKSIITFYKNYR